MEERSLGSGGREVVRLGDDFRTFLGDFVAVLSPIEFPAEVRM